MTCSHEVIHAVWDDSEGVAIKVSPDADGLGCIEIRPMDEKSEEWFGKFRLTLSKEMTVNLAHAMQRAVQDNP